MGLHRLVGGEETGFGRQVLGCVGQPTTLQVTVVVPRRPPHHRHRCVEFHVGFGERMRNRLVGADRATEHLSFVRIVRRSPQRSLTDAAGHCGKENSLRVEAVEDVVKAAPALADHAPVFDRKVVVGHLARRHRVAADLGDRRDVAVGRVEVDQEEGEAVELAGLAVGACQQQTHVRFERLARPDLATVHDPAAHAVLGRSGHDAARVGSRIRFGHPEGDVQVAGGGAGQEGVFEPFTAELHHRVESEHGEVQRSRSVHRCA